MLSLLLRFTAYDYTVWYLQIVYNVQLHTKATMTGNCRTAIRSCFLYFNICLSWTYIKCLYQVRVITVFTVFRLLTDFVCLYNYEFWLSLCKIVRSSLILLLPLFTMRRFFFYLSVCAAMFIGQSLLTICTQLKWCWYKQLCNQGPYNSIYNIIYIRKPFRITNLPNLINMLY